VSPKTEVRSTPVTVAVERCPQTGITKPECHCASCLAAMVARHRPAQS
jgi:hypothetical protein